MTKLIQCDVCGMTVEYPLPEGCGWYGVSFYKMGVRFDRRSPSKEKGTKLTVCPNCISKFQKNKTN